MPAKTSTGRRVRPAFLRTIEDDPTDSPVEFGSPTGERQPSSVERRGGLSRLAVIRLLSLLFVIAISVSIVAFRDRLYELRGLGYLGLFLINLISSATIFLPVPGLALTVAAGGAFDPVTVGLAAGAGSTLGELSGYLAGFSGRGVIQDKERYRQLKGWMTKYGIWVILALSLIPNPVFDLAGIASGVMRIPIWKFLLACCCGNVLKATVAASLGAHTMPLLDQLLH